MHFNAITFVIKNGCDFSFLVVFFLWFGFVFPLLAQKQQGQISLGAKDQDNPPVLALMHRVISSAARGHILLSF